MVVVTDAEVASDSPSRHTSVTVTGVTVGSASVHGVTIPARSFGNLPPPESVRGSL